MDKTINELVTELSDLVSEFNSDSNQNSDLSSKEEFFENKNIFDSLEDIQKEHIKQISNILIKELEHKQKLRSISVYLAIVILSVFGISIISLYITLLIRQVPLSDKLLLGITVTMFTSIIGLMTIIFKYSFSKTKDVTDHLKDSYVHLINKEKNK